LSLFVLFDFSIRDSISFVSLQKLFTSISPTTLQKAEHTSRPSMLVTSVWV
jgi:hypothetical protein